MIKRSTSFALTFVALFVLSFVFLAWADMLPEPIDPAGNSFETPALTPSDTQSADTPIRIVAKPIGLDKTVLNPESTDVALLDEALLSGTVRYPQSGLLGVDGTVLIFGHSSYLPIVHNQNFKAFNGIQKLKVGEIVSVYSAGAEYRYAVTGVRLADAEEDVIELPSVGKHLTLVTCDSFGTKSDRFVVTADFVGAYAL